MLNSFFSVLPEFLVKPAYVIGMMVMGDGIREWSDNYWNRFFIDHL